MPYGRATDKNEKGSFWTVGRYLFEEIIAATGKAFVRAKINEVEIQA